MQRAKIEYFTWSEHYGDAGEAGPVLPIIGTGIRRRLAEKGSATTLAAAVDGFGRTKEFLNSSNYSSLAKQLLSLFHIIVMVCPPRNTPTK
jgi:hypothetical protein